METQSFVLGMLMTYGVTLTTVVVIGLVKISRLVKQQQIIFYKYHKNKKPHRKR